MFGDMSILMSLIGSPSPTTAAPPTLVTPTPTIDRYMSKLLRQAQSLGTYPKVLIVEPNDYIDIFNEMLTLQSYLSSTKGSRVSICGVPVIMVPFLDDPLYKKLQSYAAISGLEITYPGTSEDKQGPHIPMAEAFGDNYGWRFTWRPYTGIGDSTLEEVTHCYRDQEDFALSVFSTAIPVGQFNVPISGFSSATPMGQFNMSTPYSASLSSNSQGAPQCSPSQSVTKPTP